MSNRTSGNYNTAIEKKLPDLEWALQFATINLSGPDNGDVHSGHNLRATNSLMD